MTAAQMSALFFDAPSPDASKTQVRWVAMPEPGPGQVSIDVAYAGVNFKDVMARRGDTGYVTAWPFGPGMDVAGTVRALGPGVEGLQVGARVSAYTGAGGLAQVALAPAALTVAVPAELDLASAAAAPGSLASAALLVGEVARVLPGESVLVHGAAGGVGQALAVLARRAGADLVLGTVGKSSRVPAALSAGYDEALVRGEGLSAAVLARTGVDGVDVVMDPTGTALLDLDLAVIGPGGRIVLFGNAGGGPPEPLPALGTLVGSNAALVGFSLTGLAARAPARVAGVLAEVLALLATGELDVTISVVDGLENAAGAQQALAEGAGPGKQVVRVERL